MHAACTLKSLWAPWHQGWKGRWPWGSWDVDKILSKKMRSCIVKPEATQLGLVHRHLLHLRHQLNQHSATQEVQVVVLIISVAPVENLANARCVRVLTSHDHSTCKLDPYSRRWSFDWECLLEPRYHHHYHDHHHRHLDQQTVGNAGRPMAEPRNHQLVPAAAKQRNL